LLAWTDSDFEGAQKALDRSGTLLDEAKRANPVSAEVQALQDDIAIERAYTLNWQGEYAKAIAVSREALERTVPRVVESAETRRSATLRRARLLDRFAESTY